MSTATMPTVTTQLRDSIAVIYLNNTPINMGNAALRSDIAAALQDTSTNSAVTAVVIASALPHFYAGSDLVEFGGELHSPELPSVIATIEQLEIPVIAAMNGLVLGGGLEFALGCDIRIGDPSVQVGFPEVTLGMVPGAGGTVRTPRVTGIPTAIDLVASARRITADEALCVGILDEIVPASELLDRALTLAKSIRIKSRVIDRAVPPAAQEEIDAVIARVGRRARPNVLEAINLVQQAGVGNPHDALTNERRVFNRLRFSDEAKNLRYLFFARRAAAKALRSKANPLPVRTVGIAGAGTMGASLARTFADHGFSVVVFDRDPAATQRLAAQVDRVVPATDIAGLTDADLVIDAVFEDMAVKTSLLRELEPVLAPTAVIVSNTSYLDLTELSRALTHPERFAGLHFFNPPHRNPLVELIPTPTTNLATAATLSQFITRLGKVGIPAGLGDGFVANRVYADYRTQAEFLVEEGSSPTEVDRAMRALGMPIGPFAVADMSGLDIAWARRKRLAATRDPNQRYVAIADRLCEAGRLGQKTGAGWFLYPDGSRRAVPDPDVDTVITAERALKGIESHSIEPSEIQNRVLASMLCATAGLVDSGIAERPSDIDVAMTEGFAFPKELGGPVREMSSRPDSAIVAALAAVYASCPVTFAIAEPASRGVLPETVAHCLNEVREQN
ncbi:3-hydroxyacyl-CoA dehydrogenase NAD-binding domain-containing protein [Rhodococcus sp. IEGM 1366]|uniref:3-hydroxyacyl-CoA dehydrogenase NAD-binding domain-containing protein n=1 Tax=Rhodococcus sp. IEGM 1366 TaxID=3082223 RepID=UPI002954238B|nr:3-hydroxyacyl-CoA dehydrogenase NAD-binding domain-containing protein [Rhodococcus sp. IEGM 1366]MDV8070903.1 3-hydroxyacyl-CoA dehydrogenase NAD-binding domain-containing protein [Rhodococcus sp. IEGM 1366]